MNVSFVRNRRALAVMAALSFGACDAVDHPVGAEATEEVVNGSETFDAGATGAAGETGAASATATTGASGASSVSEKWSKDIVRECAGGAPDITPTCGSYSTNPIVPAYALVVVIDQSLKMAQPLGADGVSRWNAVQQGLVNLYRDYPSAAGSEVSLVFSGPPELASSCSLQPLTVSPSPTEAAAEYIQNAFQAEEPAGNERPLVPALNAAFVHLAIHPTPTEELIVLITAGAPNACEGDPGQTLTEAVEWYFSGLDNEPVPTYLIELGSGVALDAVARVGGTDRAASITGGDVAAQIEQAVRNALDDVLFSRYCTFGNPFGDDSVPDGPILLGPDYAEQEQVPRLDGPEACDASPAGGYYMLDDAPETMFRYCPCSCARFAHFSARHTLTFPASVCTQ